MTMHGVFHPKSSTARLYTVEKKDEGDCTESKKLCDKKNRA